MYYALRLGPLFKVLTIFYVGLLAAAIVAGSWDINAKFEYVWWVLCVPA